MVGGHFYESSLAELARLAHIVHASSASLVSKKCLLVGVRSGSPVTPGGTSISLQLFVYLADALAKRRAMISLRLHSGQLYCAVSVATLHLITFHHVVHLLALEGATSGLDRAAHRMLRVARERLLVHNHATVLDPRVLLARRMKAPATGPLGLRLGTINWLQGAKVVGAATSFVMIAALAALGHAVVGPIARIGPQVDSAELLGPSLHSCLLDALLSLAGRLLFFHELLLLKQLVLPPDMCRQLAGATLTIVHESRQDHFLVWLLFLWLRGLHVRLTAQVVLERTMPICSFNF